MTLQGYLLRYPNSVTKEVYAIAIYNDYQKLTLFKGDYHPAGFYKGDKKIAGYTAKIFSGQSISMNGTYNDSVEEFFINGTFVSGINLFDKSLFNDTNAVLRREEPWSGYGMPVMSNSNLLSMLKADTAYTISYEAECISMPENYENYTLGGTAFGFTFYSPVSGFIYLYNHKIQAGEKVQITETFTTPANFSDSTANYRILAYSNRYDDSDGNYYFPTVIFRNITITEEPAYPVLNWNGKEIIVPHILYEGDFLHMGGMADPGKVVLYNSEITDISETETGIELLKLKTTPGLTKASVTNGALTAIVKVSD